MASSSNVGDGSPTRHGRRRSGTATAGGFTLVELLVGIAIIGILVSLIMPAVQAAREAARRAQCQNNLRQIGLAFQMHHDAHTFFPSGGWNWSDPPTYRHGSPVVGAEQRAGWGFQVLPFLEGGHIADAGVVAAVGTPSPVFFCPTRRSPSTAIYPDNYQPPITGGLLTRALCDYAASNREETGVMQRFRPRNLADIVDGTSHTLAVGEKRLNLALLGQPQDDDNEGYTAGWNEDTIRRTDRPPSPDHNSPTGTGDRLFGSSHPGALHVVLLDGSVRRVAYTVDAVAFERLGNRSDGEPVTDATF